MATSTKNNRKGRYRDPMRSTIPTAWAYRVSELTEGLPVEDQPNIIDFVVSENFLNRPYLFPRQATLLKIIFLGQGPNPEYNVKLAKEAAKVGVEYDVPQFVNIFTDYDHKVIAEWIESYKATMNADGEGTEGIVPDIYERIEICKAEGRKWFRECVMALGRRGSKGHIGALAMSYIIWNYICKGDPQDFYGVDRNKKLAVQVFAGKKGQARDNQWRDLNNVIIGAPCFTGGGMMGGLNLVSRSLTEMLTLYAPADYMKMDDRRVRRVETEDDIATFEVVPLESTVMASRGPAGCIQAYDEMAHVVHSVARADAGEVYASATPALDQFGKDAFLWEPSSPWQRMGQFYINYLKAITYDEVLDELGNVIETKPVYPEVLMAQLPSWALYEDWERATEIPIYPGGLCFQPLKGAIQTYDEQMQREERANPATFRVERRAHFAAVLDAYLDPDNIEKMWHAWPNVEREMRQQNTGIISRNYRAHGDPSKSGANFGWAIGHVEGPDDRGLPHVVFDVIDAWIPGDFPSMQIDYTFVAEELKGYLDRFMPYEMTFDQFNSIYIIQQLTKHSRKQQYPKRTTIYERTATGPLNWTTYETFKTALNLGLIHAPFFDLANQELTFLQNINGQRVDHPTSGPVQTKDVADCLAIVTYELIGTQISAFVGKSLGDLSLGMVAQGGFDPYGGREEAHDALSNFRNRKSAARRGVQNPMGRPRR